MASLRQSVKSFLTVVAFLVLTAIAIVVYSGNEEQRAELNNNNLYQKTRQVLVAAWSTVQGLTSWNLSHDLGSGNDLIDRVKDEAQSQGIENDATAWTNLWSSAKDSWNNRKQDINNNGEEIAQNGSTISDLPSADNTLEVDDIEKAADLYKMVSIEDTEDGRQLVLHSKSGREYKINWPFNKK